MNLLESKQVVVDAEFREIKKKPLSRAVDYYATSFVAQAIGLFLLGVMLGYLLRMSE